MNGLLEKLNEVRGIVEKSSEQIKSDYAFAREYIQAATTLYKKYTTNKEPILKEDEIFIDKIEGLKELIFKLQFDNEFKIGEDVYKLILNEDSDKIEIVTHYLKEYQYAQSLKLKKVFNNTGSMIEQYAIETDLMVNVSNYLLNELRQEYSDLNPKSRQVFDSISGMIKLLDEQFKSWNKEVETKTSKI